MDEIIEIKNLRKSFGEVKAVNDLSFKDFTALPLSTLFVSFASAVACFIYIPIKDAG